MANLTFRANMPAMYVLCAPLCAVSLSLSLFVSLSLSLSLSLCALLSVLWLTLSVPSCYLSQEFCDCGTLSSWVANTLLDPANNEQVFQLLLLLQVG
jgi:hypothetical protein